MANTTITLFGKTRAFGIEELHSIISRFGITLHEGYHPDATVVIEGAVMPTPLKIKAEELYEKGDVTFIDIDHFEREAAKNIQSKKLLMHLKLSADSEKLFSYLQNDYIEDALFLDLLKLYRYGEEDFFENDANRDVTAALIRRFYTEYEKNHNIQYSNIGLVNVIQNSNEPKVLETIFFLSPTQKALHNPNDTNAKLIHIIALHPKTPLKVLRHITQNGNTIYLHSIAQRAYLPSEIQVFLLQKNDPAIDTFLAQSTTLEPTTIQTLLERGYGELVAASITLDEELFKKLRHFVPIANNPSLDKPMQTELFRQKNYHEALAKNPSCVLTKELLSLEDDSIKRLLYANHDISGIDIDLERFEVELASNRTTPTSILETIFTKNIHEANEALSNNPSTPVDILYQLSFDMRYAQNVKANPAFGEHIKTTHAIGIFS